MDAGTPALVEEETIETLADDDPLTPTESEKFDFAVKAEHTMIAEEKFEEAEQWEVVKADRKTARKRRTEGGRAFATKSAGGTATLRIMAT